jgi:hypothetical protein
MKLKRKMISFFFIFTSNGVPVEWNWQGNTEVVGEKPVPVPLCPPQIPHGLTRDRTRASAMGGQRLTAWAMAQLIYFLDRLLVFLNSLQRQIVERLWMRNWKKYGRKLSWCTLINNSKFCPEGLVQNLSLVAGLRDDTWNPGFPNTK